MSSCTGRYSYDLPHHDGSSRYHRGAIELGGTVTVFVLEPQPDTLTGCDLRFTRDGDGFRVPAHVDRNDAHGRWWRAELPTAGAVTGYRFELAGPCRGYLNASGIHTTEPTDAFDFRVETGARAGAGASRPEVVYQIFIDRFARSEGCDDEGRLSSWDAPVVEEWPGNVHQFYGGDLAGIAAHIDYLRWLGVTTVMLTPFFPSPESHRYAASDFSTVDSLLGGDEALMALVARLHEAGIRCLGDLTLNHCGSTHPWFEAAQRQRNSAEASMFSFSQWPDTFDAYHDVTTLPRFSYLSEETYRRMVDGPDAAARRWLREPFSLDGWRLDVGGSVGRIGAIDENRNVRRRLLDAVAQEGDDLAIIAEIPRDPSPDLGSDGWPGALLDAGFASPVRRWLQADPVYSGTDLVSSLSEFAARLSWSAREHSLHFVGSHDLSRLASAVEGAAGRRAAFALLLTGVSPPSIFAGDEVALEGATADLARSPMPWTGQSLAPRGDHELLEVVRDLIRLRKAHKALWAGGFRWLAAWQDAVLYERATDGERVVCFVARGATTVTLGSFALSGCECLLGPDVTVEVSDDGRRLVADGERTIGMWRVAS